MRATSAPRRTKQEESKTGEVESLKKKKRGNSRGREKMKKKRRGKGRKIRCAQLGQRAG